jgi:hypothetical protein
VLKQRSLKRLNPFYQVAVMKEMTELIQPPQKSLQKLQKQAINKIKANKK